MSLLLVKNDDDHGDGQRRRGPSLLTTLDYAALAAR